MIERFAVMTKGSPRPEGERIIFCDGTGADWFQQETDLELSHWRPNRTPAAYRAGTSTEICFKFLDAPRPGLWTVAVNNHVDVDGILSVYTLLQSERALQDRETLVAAAEMGDFWEFGDPLAQRVFQGVTRLMRQDPATAARDIYQECFDRLPGLIDGTDPACDEIDESLAPLRRGFDLVERGLIDRNLLTERCAHYVVPASVVGDDLAAALYVPGFNEEISPRALFWPHVRGFWDSQRVSLVSIEAPGGWYHGLWFPGYLWADTQGRWTVPGLVYHDGMDHYGLENPALDAAMTRLQQDESATGHWSLATPNYPGYRRIMESFPLGGRFADANGDWAVSHQPPARLAEAFSDVF